jgi:hypothetical protein
VADFGVGTQIVWHVVCHKDKWLAPALHAFLQLTQEVLAADKMQVSLADEADLSQGDADG